jgi:hypothetical protein
MLGGDRPWLEVRSGLALPHRLPEDWAILRTDRQPSTDDLQFGEYIFLAGGRAGNTFARTAHVIRADGWDQQAQPLATVDDVTVAGNDLHASVKFRSDSCGAVVFYATGLNNEEALDTARNITCDDAGLHVTHTAGMKQQCASHYRDERIAMFVVGNTSGSTVVFHIFDNNCPLALYIGQPEVIAGRDVVIDDDFDGYRVDCFFRLGSSIIWGQHLGTDVITARAHLEMLIAKMDSVTVTQFDHSITR